MDTVATELQRIIFDMDDTLLKTGHLYQKALHRFARKVQDHFESSGTIEEIITRQEIIDREQLKQEDFSKQRFPRSLVKTWEYYCQAHDRTPRPEDLEACNQIGTSVYNSIPEPLEGMSDLLKELSSKFDILLYTLGDPEVQLPKIRHHKLDQLMDEVHVVPQKNEKSLARITRPFNPEQAMMVGDSLRSEIKPALNLGLNCVYRKPKFPWSYHQVEIDQPVPEITNLIELKHFLP